MADQPVESAASNPEPQKALEEGQSQGPLVFRPASARAAPKRFTRQAVPDEILQDRRLEAAMKALPANYNFEIHKTVWRIRKMGAKTVALQFPEGLQMYACIIADILEKFGPAEHVVIMGDVTYGACCIDDYSAKALSCELLVHYGHSCLVPVGVTSLPCMYVFVDIQMDMQHFVDTVRLNFEPSQRLVLAGTIQFASSMQAARQQLQADFPHLSVPQSKPLSPGEVLGCTAPVLPQELATDAIVFLADGRFHLEAIMIANPGIPAFRYDPYARVMTREEYDHDGMKAVRRSMIERAMRATVWGLVLGTLGRQGNPAILERLKQQVQDRGHTCVVVLLSEVTPPRLAQMDGIEAWVQVACPRLSIDWGEGFSKPTLTSYEAMVALGTVTPWWQEDGQAYPMDYYSKDGGSWNSSYHKGNCWFGHTRLSHVMEHATKVLSTANW